MRMKLALCGIALALLTSASAQTVGEVIAKAVAAKGGVEKIKATQSERLTGRISFGPDAEGPFLVEIKRGGKMRQEITINGKSSIRATDGVSGWAWGGSDEPSPLSAGDLKNMAGGADMDGPLLDYKSKGNQVVFAGKEKLDGKDAFKLVVTLKDGTVRNEYIDCDSYLGTKWTGKITGQDGKEFEVESFFHDYRKVDGLMFAFAIDSGTIGTDYKQKIVFNKVEINPAIDDARFGKPAASAK